jgi:hypothetical protein
VCPDGIKYILHKRVARSRIEAESRVNLGERKGRMTVEANAASGEAEA